MSETIAFLDFETTGLSVDYGDRPTEVAVVVAKSGRVVERFESLMNPGREIPEYIVAFNGITNEMVRRAPSVRTVMKDVHALIKGVPVVAHNASFERRFLQAEFARIRKRYDVDLLCSMRVARRVYRKAANYQLGTLAKHAGLQFMGNAHRAMADTEVTAALWFKMERALQRNYGLSDVPMDLMAELQGVKIASTDRFVTQYAENHGIPIEPSRKRAKKVNSLETKLCRICRRKASAAARRVKTWLLCPNCECSDWGRK